MYSMKIDGSTSLKKQNFVLAGCIAKENNWKELEIEWRNELYKQSLTCFKMYDRTRSGKSREKCEPFYRIVERHVIAVISVTIDMDALKKIVKNTIPPPHVQQWEALENPYYFAVRALSQKLAMNQELLRIEGVVKLIFDSQTEQRNIINSWEDMYQSVTSDIREKLDRSPEFRTDEEDIGLQVADMFTWFIRKWSEKEGYLKEHFEFPEGFSWKPEKDLKIAHIYYGEKEINQEFKSIIQNYLLTKYS